MANIHKLPSVQNIEFHCQIYQPYFMHTYKVHHTRVLASQTHMNDAVPSMITTELLLRCAFVTTGFPLDLHRRCIVGRSEYLFLPSYQER